jgi:hypothetical protein
MPYIEQNNWSRHIPTPLTDNNTTGVYEYNVSYSAANDPAVDCTKGKDFRATYKCGNDSNSMKVTSISGITSSGDKTALFDCSEETELCSSLKLRLGDDGSLTLLKINALNNEEVLWSNEDTQIVSDSIVNQTYKAINGKKFNNETVGRNYLNSGEFLEEGQWIGSTNGKYHLLMKNGSLQVMYNQESCNDTVGPDPNASNLYDISASNIGNLGKIGYINHSGKLIPYPSSMTGYDNSYRMVGNFNVTNINGSNLLSTPYGVRDVSNVQDCQLKCSNYGSDAAPGSASASELCAGIVFDASNQLCYLKKNNIYSEKRIIKDNNFSYYLRTKEINNSGSSSCPTTVADYEYLNTSEWTNRFTLSSNPSIMSPDVQCGLAYYTSNERASLDASGQAVINDLSNNVISRIKTLKNMYNTIVTSLSNTKKTIDLSLNELSKSRNELSDWTGEQLEQIIAMNEDTNTNMISKNLKHILWSILAIIIVILTIRITKSLNS